MSEASPVTTSREPATVRVAMWSSRHRWPVFAGWFIATIGLFVLSQAMGGIKADDPNGNPNQAQTESAKAYAVFGAGGEQHADRRRHARHHPPEPQGHRSRLPGLRGRHRHPLKGLTVTDGGATVPVFDEVQDPATAPPTAGLVSSDLSAARVTGRITGDQAKVERYLVPVRDAIAAIESDSSGFTVHSISQTLTSEDITNLINERPRPDLHHDRPDLHHPAHHVRGVRGLGRPARPGRDRRCSRRSASSASSASWSRRPARMPPSSSS